MVRTNAPSACVVDVIGTTSSPKADAEIDVSAAGPLTVAGWAAHVGGELPSGVEIAIDQKMYPATYGLPRNDVAAALNNPAYNASGFTFSIPASQLSSGAHTLAVRVINKARTGYFETPTYHIRIQ